MADIVFKIHYLDGRPAQAEVTDAPGVIGVAVSWLMDGPGPGVHLHDGRMLVIGTPGLGLGRVAYLLTGWSGRHLIAQRAVTPTDCERCVNP